MVKCTADVLSAEKFKELRDRLARAKMDRQGGLQGIAGSGKLESGHLG